MGRIPSLRSYITETYLPAIRGRLGKSTYASHRQLLTKLPALLGTQRVSDVSQVHLRTYRDQCAKSLGPNSLRLELAHFCQAFRALMA